MKQLKSNLLLALTALIWGVAFVAQSVGMDYVGPYTFNCIRSIIGGIVLIPIIFLIGKISPDPKPITDLSSSEQNKKLLIGGILCGLALGIASCLQQIGIQYTTAGKSGFITALYIVIVPLLGIFLKKKVSLKVWISVIIAVFGMYLLCMKESFTIGRGDFLIFLCAIVFSLHILIIDYFSPYVNGVKLSCIQFFIAGILSGIGMIIFEAPTLSAILSAWAPILYAGVLSCGVAYTLQIIGQKNTSPVLASLILSLESVFSLIAGWIILNERLSPKEFFGCMLVFLAIILTQLPEHKKG